MGGRSKIHQFTRGLREGELNSLSDSGGIAKASGRKFSTILLEEADELAQKIGVPEACKIMGISRGCLYKFRCFNRRKAGIPKDKLGRGRPARVSDEDVRRCARLAIKIHETHKSFSVHKCFLLAGKKLGIDHERARRRFTEGSVWL